tara:strand:- start:2555 stop:2794 length:240 start_codon:yes stop_codon:yes gene_type:complete
MSTPELWSAGQFRDEDYEYDPEWDSLEESEMWWEDTCDYLQDEDIEDFEDDDLDDDPYYWADEEYDSSWSYRDSEFFYD